MDRNFQKNCCVLLTNLIASFERTKFASEQVGMSREGQAMRSFLIVFFILSLIFMNSCALKQKEVEPWLNTISGGSPPEIDVNGRWRDGEGSWFGWGEGHLIQEQNKIRGAVGNYDIKGIVSGRKVYLVFLYHGRVYYTARLEVFRDSLVGNYFKGSDKEQRKGYPMSLVKIPEK